MYCQPTKSTLYIILICMYKLTCTNWSLWSKSWRAVAFLLFECVIIFVLVSTILSTTLHLYQGLIYRYKKYNLYKQISQKFHVFDWLFYTYRWNFRTGVEPFGTDGADVHSLYAVIRLSTSHSEYSLWFVLNCNDSLWLSTF